MKTSHCLPLYLVLPSSRSETVLEGVFPFNMGWHQQMPHVLSFHAHEVLATQLLLIALALPQRLETPAYQAWK